MPATVVAAPSSSRRIFGYHSSRSSYSGAAKMRMRLPLRVMRGTYIFGPCESTPTPADPRQPRYDLSRGVRARQSGQRRAPHGRSRCRLSARTTAARSPARYSRRAERAREAETVVRHGQSPRHARRDSSDHDTALGGAFVRATWRVVTLVLLAACGSKAEVLHAAGGLVMPGFADGHTHFIDGGFQLASVNLRDAATPQEFVRRL